MAANATNQVLLERVDVHKSCKALETVVNLFNEYCQALEALAQTQKRLGKALKDAAAMKVTGELAGNAMSLIAALFDALSDVDTRYVKFADKECEAASNELRKWFKKLAKEEKAHDERLTAANAKIKQAGQTYEKKAKRKDRDAVEEHARYVNILNAVGPEMSQEKYSHSLMVTQRHSAALASVAGTLARAAEADWTRACEHVRRVAPSVGPIGECRAFLEGGWTSGIPQSQNIQEEASNAPPKTEFVSKPTSTSSEGATHAKGPLPPVEQEVNGAASQSSGMHDTGHDLSSPSPSPATSPPSASASTSNGSSEALPRPVVPFASTENASSVRSIETLSSFPCPPAHFPVPTIGHNSSQNLPSPPPPVVPHAQATSPQGVGEGTAESPQPMQAQLPSGRAPTTPALSESSSQSTDNAEPRTPVQAAVGDRDSETIKGVVASSPSDKHPSEREKPNHHGQSEVPVKPSTSPTQKARIERTESVVSNGSIVASLRDKWDRNHSPTSSPTRDRDFPRLPNKVADLASKYVSTAVGRPLSPTRTTKYERGNRQGSPTTERDSLRPAAAEPRMDASGSSSSSSPHGSDLRHRSPGTNGLTVRDAPSLEDLEIARRRQRLVELEELELLEQQHALRARERDIELRALELERERTRLLSARKMSMTGLNSGLSAGAASTTPSLRPYAQQSYSATNLTSARAPPDISPPLRRETHGPLAMDRPTSSQPISSASTPGPTARNDHAPFCGCYSCSVSQYRSRAPTPQPYDTRPPEPPPPQLRPEKPRGGWMRRLSMPMVGSSFSGGGTGGSGSGAGFSGGDAKKGVKAVVSMVVPSEEGILVRRSFERDASGGISNVATRPRKLSFGKRH